MTKIKYFYIKYRKEVLQNILVMLLAAVIVAGVFLFWSRYKIIWFCDEIYSFFTANSEYGLGSRIQYGTWYDSQFVIDDMSADITKGKFNRTIDNVKGDDHPPIYFLTIRLMSILMKGSISKWVGLSVNLICVLGLCLMAYLIFYWISRKKLTALLACVALSTLPSVLTNGMLIRMYCMLTAWGMLYVFLSYLIMQDINKWFKYFLYLALAGTTAAGFLTQYYFAVFAVGFTAVHTIFCIIKKRWKEMCLYITSMVMSVAIATMVWGEWTEQIFEGYCGEEVFSQASNFSKIFTEILFGLTCIPKLMFYNFYIIGIILIVAGVIFLVYKKDKNITFIGMLLITSVFYSLIITHVTPTYYLDYRYFYMPAAIAYIAALLMVISCAGYLPVGNAHKILNAVLCAVIGFNILTAAFDDMSMGYVDKTGEFIQNRETLREYGNLPWVYYGYESWPMMQNYYDFAMGTRFIVYNDQNEFDDSKCLGEGQDFIFMINTESYPKQEAILERLLYAEGCNHEIDYLFTKGAKIYLVRHK